MSMADSLSFGTRARSDRRNYIVISDDRNGDRVPDSIV